jgi:quercetin dioxygenase-like cupin family protein
MKVNSHQNVEQQAVEMPGSAGCKVRWLVGQPDGAANFSMRQFEVEPGGFTPRHSHPYEHEVYILEGEGEVLEGERRESHRIRKGDFVFVAPDEVHQFKNTGSEHLKFLCLIPNSALSLPITAAPECGGD